MEEQKRLELLAGLKKTKENFHGIVKELSERVDAIYLVGGAIRDLYYGLVPQDFDFSVSNLDIVKILLEERGAKFFTLKNTKFPFVRAIFRENTLDFMEMRSLNIKTDLNNRDFTINTLYYDIKKDVLFEDRTAFSDLDSRTLRVVNENSVVDDPLRSLRAVRLIAKFHLSAEQRSADLVRKGFGLLGSVKNERKHDEMRKILQLPYIDVLKAFSTIFKIDVIKVARKVSLCCNLQILKKNVSKGVSYGGLCEIYLICKVLGLKCSSIFGLTEKETAFVNVLSRSCCNFEHLFNTFIKDGIESAVASTAMNCPEEIKYVEKWKNVKIYGDELKSMYGVQGKELGKMRLRKLREECKKIYENV